MVRAGAFLVKPPYSDRLCTVEREWFVREYHMDTTDNAGCGRMRK